VRAFCPGHITGLFSIEDSSPIVEKKGSIGIGFCVELGATAEIELADELTIYLNEEKSQAPVTRDAINIMADGRGAVVHIEHDLPMGQGFGMSAAGTFAACLALAVELDIPDPKYAALKATHISEVKHRTGLGDAVAQSVGGFVHRIEPGIPPHGECAQLDFRANEVVFCILGGPISTSDILGDPIKRKSIRDSGHACLQDCGGVLDLASFISASWAFARDSGLASGDMVKILEEINGIGQGSMVMLGNSIFAFGDSDLLQDSFKPHGKVFRAGISKGGATVLK